MGAGRAGRGLGGRITEEQFCYQVETKPVNVLWFDESITHPESVVKAYLITN